MPFCLVLPDVASVEASALPLGPALPIAGHGGRLGSAPSTLVHHQGVSEEP